MKLVLVITELNITFGCKSFSYFVMGEMQLCNGRKGKRKAWIKKKENK